jgi:tRNA acetyltransferase TAN1
MRNHTTIPRPTLIQSIAKCVPEVHTVALADPELFILVEVFKVGALYAVTDTLFHCLWSQSICGISIVEGYYKLQKFNVMEIAKVKNGVESQSESRVTLRDKADELKAA